MAVQSYQLSIAANENLEFSMIAVTFVCNWYYILPADHKASLNAT